MLHNSSNKNISLLSGVKVLDLSRILAGPWATQLLADYGASVWKIEKPITGDDTRSWGPPFLHYKDQQVAAYFLAANRGKQSLAIDVTKAEGQELILKLAIEADVIVENFKVDALKKYALDYNSVKKINPKIIYCSITGFGQTGEQANQPGYDAMIQAIGGLMSVTGNSSLEGGEPQKVGVAVADLMTGMYAANAILAALNYRHQSGEGQYIDLALLDCQIAMLANQAMNYLVSGQVPERFGNGHPNIVPYQTLMCADGYIMLAVGNDHQFSRLCEQMNLVALAGDERFLTNALRVKNRTSLMPVLQKTMLEKSVGEWVAQLTAVNVPCSSVNNIEQSFALPQVKQREMQVELNSPYLGQVPQVANPVKFSIGAQTSNLAPPMLGADTLSVLSEVLQMDNEAIDELISKQVISLINKT